MAGYRHGHGDIGRTILPHPPLNLPQVRGLKRASLRLGVIRPATLQPGRF